MKKLLIYLKDKLRRRLGLLSPSREMLGLEKLKNGRVVDTTDEERKIFDLLTWGPILAYLHDLKNILDRLNTKAPK